MNNQNSHSSPSFFYSAPLPPQREYKQSCLGYFINIITILFLIFKLYCIWYIHDKVNTMSPVLGLGFFSIFEAFAGFFFPGFLKMFYLVVIMNVSLLILFALRLSKPVFTNKTARTCIHIIILIFIITEFYLFGFPLIFVPSIIFNAMNFLSMKNCWAFLFYPYYEVDHKCTYSLEDPYRSMSGTSFSPMQNGNAHYNNINIQPHPSEPPAYEK